MVPDHQEACGAATGDAEQVWAGLRKDLRARMAVPVEQA
jgi:hypothetical protein